MCVCVCVCVCVCKNTRCLIIALYKKVSIQKKDIWSFCVLFFLSNI